MAEERPGRGVGNGAAPPTASTFDDDGLLPEPPKWPKVVGIVSIVYSALGLFCGGCGTVYLIFVLPWFMEMAESQMGGPAPAIMQPSPIQLVFGAVGFVWSIVLLSAGIATVMRRPAGRVLHLVYAAGGLPLTLVSTYIGVQQQLAVAEWARQNPGDPWAKQGGDPTIGLAITAVFALLGIAWPVFCLVWFGLVKRDAAAMTGSAGDDAAGAGPVI